MRSKKKDSPLRERYTATRDSREPTVQVIDISENDSRRDQQTNAEDIEASEFIFRPNRFERFNRHVDHVAMSVHRVLLLLLVLLGAVQIVSAVAGPVRESFRPVSTAGVEISIPPQQAKQTAGTPPANCTCSSGCRHGTN